MITDPKALAVLRNALAEYVKQLSEELLYWMEELHRLELATGNPLGPVLSAGMADAAGSGERETGEDVPPPLV